MQTAAQPVPPALPQRATSGIPARILSLAPALAQALGEAGGTASATISGRLAGGGTMLSTAHGDIALKLQALLKLGLNVTLTLPPNPTPNMAALVTPMRTRNPSQPELPPSKPPPTSTADRPPIMSGGGAMRPPSSPAPAPSGNDRIAHQAAPLPSTMPRLPSSGSAVVPDAPRANAQFTPAQRSPTAIPKPALPPFEPLAKAPITNALPVALEPPKLAGRKLLVPMPPSVTTSAPTTAPTPEQPKARLMLTPLTLAQHSPDAQSTNVPKHDGQPHRLSTDYVRDRIQKIVSQDVRIARYQLPEATKPGTLMTSAEERPAATGTISPRLHANAPSRPDISTPPLQQTSLSAPATTTRNLAPSPPTALPEEPSLSTPLLRSEVARPQAPPEMPKPPTATPYPSTATKAIQPLPPVTPLSTPPPPASAFAPAPVPIPQTLSLPANGGTINPTIVDQSPRPQDAATQQLPKANTLPPTPQPAPEITPQPKHSAQSGNSAGNAEAGKPVNIDPSLLGSQKQATLNPISPERAYDSIGHINRQPPPAMPNQNQGPLVQNSVNTPTPPASGQPLATHLSEAPPRLENARALSPELTIKDHAVPSPPAQGPTSAPPGAPTGQHAHSAPPLDVNPKSALPPSPSATPSHPPQQPPGASSAAQAPELLVTRPLPPQSGVPVTPISVETPVPPSQLPTASLPLPERVNLPPTEALLRPNPAVPMPIGAERPRAPLPQMPFGPINTSTSSILTSPIQAPLTQAAPTQAVPAPAPAPAQVVQTVPESRQSTIPNAVTQPSGLPQATATPPPALTLLTPSQEMQAIVQVLTRPPGTETAELLRPIQSASADAAASPTNTNADDPGAEPPDLRLDLIATPQNSIMSALEDGIPDPSLKTGDDALIAEAGLSALGFFRLETRQTTGGFNVTIRHVEVLDGQGLETLGDAAIAEADRFGVRARVRFVHDPALERSL